MPQLMIGVVVLAIALTVGLEVMDAFATNIESAEFEPAAENTTTVCNGFGGCGGGSSYLIVAPVAALLSIGIGVVIGGVAHIQKQRTPETPTGPTVESVKQRYIDGEIRTEIKLEQELSDVLDPTVDASTITEIDDLLDNNDDSD